MEHDEASGQYLVHYIGWNAKFDEYVTGERLRKLSSGEDFDDFEDGSEEEEENEQKNVKEPSEKKKRKKSIQQDGVEELPLIASELIVELPKILERVLFDDWKKIVAQGCLVSLPRRPSIANVMNQYRDDVLAQKEWSEPETAVLKEMCSGLLRYFDRLVGLQLLYRVERLQYLDMLESYPSTPMSQLYGPEHFLRLMTRMPNIVQQSALDEMRSEEIFVFNSHIASVLRYLVKRSGELFGSAYYENQAPEYQRLLNL